MVTVSSHSPIIYDTIHTQRVLKIVDRFLVDQLVAPHKGDQSVFTGLHHR